MSLNRQTGGCLLGLRHWGCVAVIVALASYLSAGGTAAENAKVTGVAPANHAVLKHTRGGAWFVARGMKEQYDRLLGQVRSLQAGLDADTVSAREAQLQISELRAELEKLRKEIDERKVLVTPVKVHTQSETTTFDFGPERLLVITADNVEVQGWEGPGVKCVLEKTVLSAGDADADEHLAGLKLIHRHGTAPELVGRTKAELDEGERTFLDSPEGQKLTDQQRAARRDFVRGISEYYSQFHDFQGKPVDAVEIEGLTHDQGNRQISVEVRSDGGGGTLGGDWQRHASLTVYVPRCQAVALRGCLVRLDVSGLVADLVVTTAGSLDRDYDGTFEVRDLHGSLTVDNAPLDLVDSVTGNVTILSTVELANTGTNYEDDQRISYTPPPRELTCQAIDGSLRAVFTRARVTLSDISGAIDVQNDFGSTELNVTRALAEKPHRIVSQSGRVAVHLAHGALGDLAVRALTNCGTVRTNTRREVLEEVHFSTANSGPEAVHRDWRGFQSNSLERFWPDIDRLAAVLAGADRSRGLDLVTRSGTLVLSIDP